MVMKKFNANWQLAQQLKKMTEDAGIILPPPTPERSKVFGFMGSRGEYKIGDCSISTYGHYGNEDDDSHYSLKFYKGKDAHWYLAADESGRVWFSPTGFFRTEIESLTDWEETPFTLE